MTRRSAKEFQRDIEMRQRNVVFPDTLRNETRGWRNLITSKEPLSVMRVIALLLFYLLSLSCLFWIGYAAFEQFQDSDTSGSGLSRVVSVFGPWVIILMLFGAVFLLLRWRIRKALGGVHKRSPHAK